MVSSATSGAPRQQRPRDAKSGGEDGVVAAPTTANTSMFLILVCSDTPSSMRYQNRYFRRAQNALGKAAEDPLAQPAMAVAAHHQ